MSRFWRLTRFVASFILVALVVGEISARVLGALNFPLYDVDNIIGYIPKSNQSGSFLNKNDWVFNDLHMGSRQFAPSAKMDVLLVGDSIVLGGNPLRQSERLASQMEVGTDLAVWPISAGSWSLSNELTYLRQHAEVVSAVDVIVFVLNTADLDNASVWTCELTHPRTRPTIALWYLFKRYVFGFRECEKSVAPDLAVAHRDLLIDTKKFLNEAGKNVIFILYPNKSELADMSLWKKNSTPLKNFLLSAGAKNVVDLTDDEDWDIDFYRDVIHLKAKGNSELALVIKGLLNVDSKRISTQ